MNKILYTGFKGRYNSSFCLIKLMSGDKVLLTNSFGGIVKDIDGIENDYEKIIMFGLDKNLRSEIRFEKAAKLDGELLICRADISEYIKKAHKLNVGYTVSDKPTAYLCNYAYFNMMKKFDTPVIFIHIPSLKNMSEDFMLKLKEIFSC